MEQALKTALLILSGQKASGYCPDMISADFLAGTSQDPGGNADSLLLALRRIYLLFPECPRQKSLLRVPNTL